MDTVQFRTGSNNSYLKKKLGKDNVFVSIPHLLAIIPRVSLFLNYS